MSYEIRARQARCAALGFWPGPIDGIDGRRTREAYAAAVAAQRAKGLPFQHSSGITRLHLHWTAGGHKANAVDRRAYHFLAEGDGKVIFAAPPEVRRSQTLNANGGAIGLSVCCMAGAQERPFNPGSAPMTVLQLHAMARQAAVWCRFFDIPVSRWSVLTHAEVQPTLGIKQRFKWDITWLPGMPGPSDPIDVGDRIRGIIRAQVASS